MKTNQPFRYPQEYDVYSMETEAKFKVKEGKGKPKGPGEEKVIVIGGEDTNDLKGELMLREFKKSDATQMIMEKNDVTVKRKLERNFEEFMCEEAKMYVDGIDDRLKNQEEDNGN